MKKFVRRLRRKQVLSIFIVLFFITVSLVLSVQIHLKADKHTVFIERTKDGSFDVALEKDMTIVHNFKEPWTVYRSDSRHRLESAPKKWVPTLQNSRPSTKINEEHHKLSDYSKAIYQPTGLIVNKDATFGKRYGQTGAERDNVRFHVTTNTVATQKKLSLEKPSVQMRESSEQSATFQRSLKLKGDEWPSSLITRQPGYKEKIFVQWLLDKSSACNGSLEVFPGFFVSLREALFRKDLVQSKNSGGEDLTLVVGQAEEDEYYTINKGFFSLPCPAGFPWENPLLSHGKGHLHKWLVNTISHAKTRPPGNEVPKHIQDFTIVVKRYEYVNLYHTMTDFYAAFLMMKFFHKTPQETNILIFDTHPKGSLDPVWKTLFGSFIRVSQLQPITHFEHAIWSIPGYDSPMFNYENPERIPLIEEFRQFFLSRHGLSGKPSLDCELGLRLVVIWRRDYVAHPRNPSGHVERKIWNEQELIDVANKTGLFSSVIGIQLDRLSMKRQLSIISSADILVGMHGAGLTHSVFLPPYAGMIELVPEYSPQLGHFEGIAQWRNLHYLRWKNADSRNEKTGRRTRIPAAVFHKLLARMKGKLCHSKQTSRRTKRNKRNVLL